MEKNFEIKNFSHLLGMYHIDEHKTLSCEILYHLHTLIDTLVAKEAPHYGLTEEQATESIMICLNELVMEHQQGRTE
jgi:hypothetical protein